MTLPVQRMFSVLAITVGLSLCGSAPRAKARDMGPSRRMGSSYRIRDRGDSRFIPGRVGTTVRRHSSYQPFILREPHRVVGPRDRHFSHHSYPAFGHHRSFVGRGSYGPWPSFYRPLEQPCEPYWPSTYAPYGDRYDYGNYLDAYRRTERYLILQETVRDREEAVYSTYQDLLDAGLTSFRDREYRQAANLFVAAADANQADAACRVHAAHALFAVGEYRPAVVILRRAFQLQPKIVALRYDIRSDYTDPQDFRSQVIVLEQFVRAQPDDPTLHLLLGYVRMYSGDRDGASQALRSAVRFAPRDDLALRLLEAAGPPDFE